MSATKLKIVHSECMGDWYTIERVEHAGVSEIRTVKGYSYLVDSGLISDACVEGTAHEMRDIATAIEQRGSASYARRCAVDATTDQVRFWSPRNSREPGVVSRDDADALAKMIRELLPEPSPSESEVKP